jgi:hypothetical protein
MPIDEKRAAEIRSLINAAKQQPVHFGICLGPKPDTDTLLMHRSKAPKALSMEARTEAKGTKVAFGSATVEGSLLSLTCDEKPPGGLAKRTRIMLKAMKLNLKVRLVGADGEVYEEDGEEEPAPLAPGKTASGTPPQGVAPTSPENPPQGVAPTAPEDPPPPPPPPPAPPPPPDIKPLPDAAALTKLLMALASRIPGAAGDNAERKAALAKLATQAQTYLKTSNLAYAQTTIEQLRSEIEGGSPTPPPPPGENAAQLTRTLGELAKRIPEVAGQDATLRGKLVALVQDAGAKIKAADLAGAGTVIASLRDALDVKSTTSPDQGQAGLETYRTFAKKWLDMRQQVEDEMEKLRLTIADAYKGDVSQPAIDQAFRATTAPVLRTLDASLAVKLEAAGKAAQAEARQKLVAEALGVIDGYRTYAADKLLADLDNNPFVPLSLQASLNATLAELAAEIH